MSDDPILETENVTKTFGSLYANENISLTVSRDEMVGLIGPNGAGKSTFFNTVTGFLKPDGGRIVFDGTDITGWKPHRIAQRGLSRTFQIVSPFREMTVRDNLMAVHNDDLDDQAATAEETLEFLEIDHLANNNANDLSGGQQKLLELARVMMLEPECILLDEPTAGVNPVLEKKILEKLGEMNDAGTSFIVVEHDMEVIEDIADRVVVFNQGKLLMEGSFQDVKGDPRVREAYLGEDPEGDVLAEKTRRTAEIGEGASGNDAVVAENVITGYGNHQVINGVSVRTRPGITCIFGPNGSGKSTLLNTLNGAVPVWSGTIHYNGTDLTEMTPEGIVAEGISTLPQDGGLFSRMSVRDNLYLGGYLHEDDEVTERLETVLEKFPELESKLDNKAADLSGGQRMMVSFGRAMMADADVYLLDEPSAGLAPSMMDVLFGLVETLAEDGSQVVLVEQNVKEGLRIADYVYILARGELQFEGYPSDLKDEDELMDLYLGI